jgi:hypothetical protein
VYVYVYVYVYWDQFGRIEPWNGVGLCSIRFLNQ